METVLDAEAFVNEWEFSHGFVARFRPLDEGTPRDRWDYCEIDYPLVPTEGRHRGARYRLALSVSSASVDATNAVDDGVTTAEFELDTWGTEQRTYPTLFGLSADGDRVVEHTQHREDLDEAVGDLAAFDYLQLRLEYLPERTSEQLDGTSPEEARLWFVELLEEENEFRDPEDALDPDATFF